LSDFDLRLTAAKPLLLIHIVKIVTAALAGLRKSH